MQERGLQLLSQKPTRQETGSDTEILMHSPGPPGQPDKMTGRFTADAFRALQIRVSDHL